MQTVNELLKLQQVVSVIVVDEAPLAYLATNAWMSERMGGRLHYVTADLLVIEASISGLNTDGSVQAAVVGGGLTVCQTEVGRMYRAALQSDASFRGSVAAKRAVIDWMFDLIDQTPVPMIVVYEDPNMKRLLERYSSDMGQFALSISEFLKVLASCGTK